VFLLFCNNLAPPLNFHLFEKFSSLVLVLLFDCLESNLSLLLIIGLLELNLSFSGELLSLKQSHSVLHYRYFIFYLSSLLTAF